MRKKKNSAIIAGISLLVMAIVAPIVNFVLLPKLYFAGDASATINAITNNSQWLWAVILGFLLVIILDIIVALVLREYLKDVDRSLSNVSALLRVLYALSFLGALIPLVMANYDPSTGYTAFITFDFVWNLALVIFGIHLFTLGILFLKANRVTRFLGLLLIVAGIGYIVDTVLILLYVNLGFELSMVTFIGEVFLIVWLLFIGRKRELNA